MINLIWIPKYCLFVFSSLITLTSSIPFPQSEILPLMLLWTSSYLLFNSLFYVCFSGLCLCLFYGFYFCLLLLGFFCSPQLSFRVCLTMRNRTGITDLVLYFWCPLSILVFLASCICGGFWYRPWRRISALLSSLGSIQRFRSYYEHCFKGLKVHMPLLSPDRHVQLLTCWMEGKLIWNSYLHFVWYQFIKTWQSSVCL